MPPATILGELISIEERPGNEVLPDEIARTLKNVTVRNPAFDITPAEYIDLIVTEEGAIPPQMAYIIIREYLGWGIEEFHKAFEINTKHEESFHRHPDGTVAGSKAMQQAVDAFMSSMSAEEYAKDHYKPRDYIETLGTYLKVTKSMEIAFTKMHGNGNDFILIDEFERTIIPDDMKGQFAAIYCDRRFGIGADGVICLSKSAKSSIRMRLFQPDESEAEMCGNGIRCLAKYAIDTGYVKETCTVETSSGEIPVSMEYRDDEFFATVTMPRSEI